MSVDNGKCNRAAVPPESGVVYTPFSLAQAIVDALGDRDDVQWLEPAHGKGAFLQALWGFGVPKTRIKAIDLERRLSPADCLAQTCRGVDFLRWYRSTSERFDRIIGNPPYVAISQLPPSLQKTAASVLDLNGNPIGKGANTWYGFVLASLRLLREGGSIGFVLPSAAEYANYSRQLREFVWRSFRNLDMYRCRHPLFAEVQEGTIVAIARGYGKGPCTTRRREVQNLGEMERQVRRGPGSRKHPCPTAVTRPLPNAKTLGELATVGLGGVTGDADFFLLTEQARRDLQLPVTCLVPVVSRARHLKTAVIGRSRWNGLRFGNERIWLFDPSDGDLSEAHVGSYLLRKPSEGGCRRSAYKISNRDPWYRTPLPKKPHGFISGMTQHGPWICFSGMQGLNATNTLYVVRFNDEIDENLRFGWALGMLTSAARRQIRSLSRRYADGLRKFEPSGLKQIRLTTPPSGTSYRPLYVRAVEALLKGLRQEARRIADEALLR